MIYCRKQFDVFNYATFLCMTCHIMRYATSNLRRNCRSALEWGQPYSKFSFGEVYRLIYALESHFMAPLPHHRKTKYPTVYLTIYLPKWKFWIWLSPLNVLTFFRILLRLLYDLLWHVLSMPLFQTIWTQNWNQTASCQIRVYMVCYLQQT